MGLSLWQILIIVVMLAFQAVPAFIAFRRMHTRKWLVLLVSFLTIIGWIIALIWALNGETDEKMLPLEETFK